MDRTFLTQVLQELFLKTADQRDDSDHDVEAVCLSMYFHVTIKKALLSSARNKVVDDKGGHSFINLQSQK